MFKNRMLWGDPHFRESWRSPFQKGDLKYVVLDLIKDKPRYGYEIIQALEEHSHGFYKPSPGVVYPTLQMFEEMGYATSIEMDGKKVYTITDIGLQFLDKHSRLADRVKRHMKRQWNPENIDAIDQIMAKFVEFRESVEPRIRGADSEKLKRISEVVSRACKEIEAMLEE